MARWESLLSTGLGYILPGMVSLSWRAGKILQMVSTAREVVRMKSKRGSGWEKVRGRERKENRGPWEFGS